MSRPKPTLEQEIENKKRIAAYRKKYMHDVWYPKNKTKHIADNAAWNKQNRMKKRLLLDEIKMREGCLDCGYKEDAVALEFDHKDNEKNFSVGSTRMLDQSWSKIEKEIEKCDVVCANCHRIRHMSKQRKELKQIVGATD